MGVILQLLEHKAFNVKSIPILMGSKVEGTMRY